MIPCSGHFLFQYMYDFIWLNSTTSASIVVKCMNDTTMNDQIKCKASMAFRKVWSQSSCWMLARDPHPCWSLVECIMYTSLLLLLLLSFVPMSEKGFTCCLFPLNSWTLKKIQASMLVQAYWRWRIRWRDGGIENPHPICQKKCDWVETIPFAFFPPF